MLNHPSLLHFVACLRKVPQAGRMKNTSQTQKGFRRRKRCGMGLKGDALGLSWTAGKCRVPWAPVCQGFTYSVPAVGYDDFAGVLPASFQTIGVGK